MRSILKLVLAMIILINLLSCSSRTYDENLRTMHKVGVINLMDDIFYGLSVDYDGRVNPETYAVKDNGLGMASIAEEMVNELLNERSDLIVQQLVYDRQNLQRKFWHPEEHKFRNMVHQSLKDARYSSEVDHYLVFKGQTVTDRVRNIQRELMRVAIEYNLDAILLIANGTDVNKTKPKLVGSFGILKQEFWAHNNIEPFAAPDLILFDTRTNKLLYHTDGKFKPLTAEGKAYFETYAPEFEFKKFNQYSNEEKLKLKVILDDLLKYNLYYSLHRLGLIDYHSFEIIHEN